MIRHTGAFKATLLGGLILASLSSCSTGEDRTEVAVPGEPATGSELEPVELPPAPDDLSDVARAVLDAFFEASLEGSPHAAALDSLTDCGDGGSAAYFPTMILATWSYEPFQMRGDTVVARAAVTTVAEQDVDRRSGGFAARQRVRTDILEWDVYQNDDGLWVVCNGMRFGYHGADSLTVWRPDSASYLTARALADSLMGRSGKGRR